MEEGVGEVFGLGELGEGGEEGGEVEEGGVESRAETIIKEEEGEVGEGRGRENHDYVGVTMAVLQGAPLPRRPVW